MKLSLLKLSALSGFLLFSVAVLLPADARAQGTTASIRGTITDRAGEPLPGANVVAVHQPSGSRYGASTDAEGRYNLQGLRVGGPYRVTASFIGYQEVSESGLNLTLGQTRTIDFELAEAAQELEAVEIVGERNSIINSNRTGAQTNISEEDIERLPTIERSLSDFARLSPLSTGRGGNSLAGRNAQYNNIQVDGATLNDVFGLSDNGTPGGQAGTQPISLDAIKEFNVEVAPYDVRQSGFTGGSINAITKSGTNEFEGSVRYRRGSEAFVGDFEGSEYGDFSENLFVGTLGGPIIEDKLFFFVNGEVKRESSPVFGGIAGMGPNRPNDFDISDSQLEALGFDSVEGVLQEISSIAQEQYGYDAGGFGDLTGRQDSYKFLAKLDWNINQNHRLTIRNNYVDAADDNTPGRSNDNYDFRNAAYVFNSTQNSFTAQLNSTISGNMYNEARLVYTRIRDNREVQNTAFPETIINLDDSGDKSVTLGIGRFNQANRLDQDLFEFTNDFFWTLGDHELTLGTSNQMFVFDNLFIQDYYGAYEFNPFGEDENATTAIEAFRQGRPTRYFASYSLSDDPQPSAQFSGFLFGLYAQDEWSVTDRLNLTLGLRGDVPYTPEEPTFNPTAYEAFGRSTSDVASGFDTFLFSPRFGFNYNADGLAGDYSTQIRGGTGVFSGRPPFVFISNQYSNSGADLARIDKTFNDPGQLDAGDCYSATADPEDLPRPGGACEGLEPVQTTEINLIEDDFTYPQTWRTDLAVDQELPGGFTATVEALYSNTLNDVTYRNINLEQVDPANGLAASKYGRPLYGTPDAYNAESRNIVSERFTNALLLENTNKGYEWLASIQLQRQLQGQQGFSGSVSYTFNRAENVNNATSSRAISNWQYNENFDINDTGLGTADFEVRHRFLGYGSYRFAYGEGNRFGTTIGLIYEGNSGAPFSWIYAGDANADGQPANDLIYVPETQDDLFLASDNWDALNAYIEGEPSLDEARGTVVDRNTARAPWVNLLDLQLTQSIATFQGQRIEINANLENLFAFADEALGIENDLGTIENTSFNNLELLDFEGYVTEEDVGSMTLNDGDVQLDAPITTDDVGKPIVDFPQSQINDKLDGDRFNTSEFASRWRLRLGIRYTF